MREPKKYIVFPGQMIISTAPALISTILGSCVSVCLWDNVKHIGGMNHYLLPGDAMDDAGNANRGMSSTKMLIRSLLNRNAYVEDLEAKIFGGCNSLYQGNDLYRVGERNVEMAIQVLSEFHIPLKGRHTGGSNGRKIVFNTITGKVRMRLLKKSGTAVNDEINKGFNY